MGRVGAAQVTLRCRRCHEEFNERGRYDRHLRKVHGVDPRRFPLGPLLAAAVLLVAIAGGAYALLAKEGAPTDVDALDLAHEPRLGLEDAPVTLVMFEDPSCPYCRVFHIGNGGESTFDRLVETYVAQGTVRMYYKEYLSAMLWGPYAASAQECAREQGDARFWELTHLYYRDAPGLTPTNIAARTLGYAETLGMDVDALQECVADGRARERVQLEIRQAEAAGVGGTPSFLVFGPEGRSEIIVGPQSFETFAAAIERAKGPA